MNQAIAICRVSTPEQRLNNSLNRQEASVKKAATELGVEIIKTWSGDASSKVGKNVNRKDLTEAYKFCKSNKRIKYLIVDEVDRLMRSIEEMFYWRVKLKEIGVVVHFASNPELNGEDAKSRLLLTLDGYKSEGSNEERQHKSIVGHQKAIEEGRYTFNAKPGYMKGASPGVHVPHPVTYEPLRAALKDVLSGIYSPREALNRLNKSSFSKKYAQWKMDKFRKYATDPYYAGILIKDKQVKASNRSGLHQPMITVEEHEKLVDIFKGTLKLRGHQKQYNPEFPMNKILTCGGCGDHAKFTGSRKNNGYNKKKTKHYYKYHCRVCSKGYHRHEVHEAIYNKLESVTYDNAQRQDFMEALAIVWEQKNKDKLNDRKELERKLDGFYELKSKLVISIAQQDATYHDDLKTEIDRVKGLISTIEEDIKDNTGLGEDLLDFVKFGLEYTNELKNDWWELDHEDRVRCQQLIFPGGISFNSEKKVGTSQISAIYSYNANKKDLREDRKSLLVELAGSAPASISFTLTSLLRTYSI